MSGPPFNLEEIFEGSNSIRPDAHREEPKAQKITAADGHEYHKSSSANATEAPTNKATVERANERANEMVKGLDYPQTEFVLMCQMYFDVTGKLIPPEEASKRYGLDVETYTAILKAPAVEEALVQNGIITRDNPDALLPKGAVLTPKQLLVANVMLDLIDARPPKKKLQDNGCTTLEWDRWLRQPAFQAYLREKSESVITNGQHEAALALMDRVRAGDPKAIQFYYEYIGKFVPSAKQGTTVNVGSNQDTQFIVTQLIEIISEEVTDPDTAARIADRVKNLITAARVASQIIDANSAIEIPESAPMRDQSEIVKQIQERAGVSNA